MIRSLMLSALLAASPVADLEMITVTDTSFTLSFVTEEACSAGAAFGTDRNGPLDGSASDPHETRFHYVTVDGLEPGADYYYRVTADGREKPPAFAPARKVTTLVPPDGARLMSFAVMNDIHLGEDVAGLILLPISWAPPLTNGFTWKNPADNYWDFTVRHTVRQVNESDAELAMVNGDLTSWFTEEEFALVKNRLDAFEIPYYVTRGNHDRVEGYPEDYFLKTFGYEHSWYSVDHKGFHFVLLDDNRLTDGWHGFPEEEWAWFESDLAENRDKPTFIFCHRPVGAGGVDIDKGIQARFLALVRQNPQVAAVFNGHSHQARVTVKREAGPAPFIEIPSVKEYPVGHGMVEVYEGGFMYNFHLTDCPDCREWNHVTRGQYFGLAPAIIAGGIEDRNFTHEFPRELRELTAASRAARHTNQTTEDGHGR